MAVATKWIFIHGWGSDSRTWSSLAEQLGQPYECLEIPINPSGSATESLAECLDQLAQRLPQQCVLVGWSLGGMLATQLAARYPQRVCALITLATNVRFVASAQWPDAMAAEDFGNFYQRFSAHPLKTFKRFCALQAQGDCARARVAASLLAQTSQWQSPPTTWLTSLSWLEQLDNREVLATLKCRQLHVFGAEDALVPVAAANAIAERFNAPVDILPGVAHAPHISQTESLAARLRAWFAQSPSAAIAKRDIAHSFSVAATQYDQHAHLQRQVAEALLHKVPQISAGLCLDLGCGTGFVGAGLLARKQQVVGLDIATGMLAAARQKHPGMHLCAGDLEALPLAERQFDQVVSSLSVQWCSSLRWAAQESWRVLKPGGSWAFSTLTDGTLWELKKAWSAVDDYVHVNHFERAETLLEHVKEAGFDAVQVTPWTVTMAFDRVNQLLRELKAIGAHNMNLGRNRKLTSPTAIRAMERAYEPFRTPSGQYPATYQVLFIVAQRPESS